MKIRAKVQLLAICFALYCWITLASIAHAQAPKLRVAYTAFASTFTILWVGKDSGL